MMDSFSLKKGGVHRAATFATRQCDALTLAKSVMNAVSTMRAEAAWRYHLWNFGKSAWLI
jgi:hypothetical protein